MNRTALKLSLVKHEGLRLTPYVDSACKITIGVGRNLSDVGVSEHEAMALLDNDINAALKLCQSHVACFGVLSDMRQNVMVEMAFNLGMKLVQFSKMMAALERCDFAAAAEEMVASAWAKEVGQRAADLATQMRIG